MPVEEYIKSINANVSHGDYTEMTHRKAFGDLLDGMLGEAKAFEETGNKNGNKPDYIVEKEKTPLGFIETKDLKVDLDKVEKDDQLRRYFEAIGNVILTNYLEFRWYVKQENPKNNDKSRLVPIQTIAIAKFDGNKIKLLPDGEANLAQLLKSFVQAKVSTVSDPKDLASRLSSIAILIRNSISEVFQSDEMVEERQLLDSQLNAFKENLISDLEPVQFADMYAQTICYGLFSAKIAINGKELSWESASNKLPSTNPFLKRIFNEFTQELPESVKKHVGLVINLLNHTDLESVLSGFGKGSAKDPIFHFYETFLSEYNPKEKEHRGVYYTPEPVVSYIVRSVDIILKEKFGMKKGLADSDKITLPDGNQSHKLIILDPATGTGTFLYSVLGKIFDNLGYGRLGKLTKSDAEAIDKEILSRIYGFELMMAPYTIAHMKLGLLLQEKGYEGSSRLNIYLTNTLDRHHEKIDKLPGGGFERVIAIESVEASKAKTSLPIMVVIGNPPYSGHSANKIPWMDRLMRGQDDTLSDYHETTENTSNYFKVDGQDLGERNPKWLNDDYVKFIRWGQWRIEKTGAGVLAFITNHGYLDNPTFRGMRQSLLETFDEIYVLDLHGNAKKKEACLDGSKDENVFDIQQGVSIGLFVKLPRNDNPPTSFASLDKGGARRAEGSENDESKEPPYPPSQGGQSKEELRIRAKQYGFVWDEGFLPYNPNLMENAKQLRKNMTPAERKLWYEFLKNNELKFLRQHPIDNFIVDFYCSNLRLVIEVDGDSHDESDAIKADKQRDDVLRDIYALHVIRISNNDVMKNFEGVCQMLDEKIKNLPTSFASLDNKGASQINSFASLMKGGARRAEGSENNGFDEKNPPTPLHKGGKNEEIHKGGNEQDPFASLDKGGARRAEGAVFHADLFGLREVYEDKNLTGGKYAWLQENDIRKTEWKQVNPAKPFYMFIPSSMDENDDYKSWPSMIDLMPVNSVGIVTARDGFVFDYSERELESRIKDFLFGANDAGEIKRKYLSKNDKLNVDGVRNSFKDKNINKYIQKCLYRPFDIQSLFYFDGIIERSRSEVMRHMLAGENLGLITCRQQSQQSEIWSLVGITNKIIESCSISNKTREINYLYPLYLYPDPNPTKLAMDTSPWPEGTNGRRPNLDKKIVDKIASDLGLTFIPDGSFASLDCGDTGRINSFASLDKGGARRAEGSGNNELNEKNPPTPLPKGGKNEEIHKGGNEQHRAEGSLSFGPEDLFNYIYAVLHNPTYRTRYADFLKYDFPRVPFTKDTGLFWQLALLGQKLASLHLLEDSELDDFSITFSGDGDNIVEYAKYESGKVKINNNQYFEGISQEVWDFMVGGYQVASKWLKDRKGRVLSHEDRLTYVKIMTALEKTITIMKQIDGLSDSLFPPS